jgi:acetylornithine deacetylase/succinyl-diaminopimelate desuccinylase-like protein
VQVYSAAALLRAGERPRRDVVFCGVVEEEVGGAGALYWAEHLDYPVELIILGEPSSNTLALGHRGIAQFWLTFHGRSAHASAPERADNPNYALAGFLPHLEAAARELRAHPILGPTSVAPTIIEVDTTSPNVTPAWTRVLLDFRTAAESINGLQAFVARLAGESRHSLAYAEGLEPSPLVGADAPITGFYTPPDSPLVARAQAAIGRGMGRILELTNYRFATDGRHFALYGLPVLGFAPGEERMAHTAGESIALDEMAESLRGHVQLLRDF